MSGVRHVTVAPGEAEARLDRWFKRRYPHISHGRLEKLLRTGQVRVDGARAKANQRLSAGQQIRVPPLEPATRPGAADEADEHPARAKAHQVSAKDAAFIRSLVVHEDDDVIALNKPSGLAVQGGAKTTRHVDGLASALTPKGEPPRLAHRLDRDTSGLLLLGKSPRATAALARAFAHRSARKTYWALTVGAPHPRQGLMKGFLRKGAVGGDREKMIAARQGDPGAVHARTLYASIAVAGTKAAWVALQPQTGRTHQLRVHMSMLGCAIVGDKKYTCDRPTPEGLTDQLHLHAQGLALEHPNGRDLLTLSAPLPAHMEKAFALLGFQPSEYADPFDE